MVLTAFASAIVVFVYRGRLAFNTRDVPSLWLEWLGRLADLTTAAPGWARDTDLPLFRAIAIWIAVAVAGVLLLRLLERRTGRARALPTVAVAIVAAGVMVASTAVWAVHATNGRTASPSQLELLERASATRHAVALQLNPWSRLPLADVPGRLRIELSRVLPQRRAGRETAPLFALPAIPAGRYRLSAVSDDPRGWLMVGIARDPRDPFALQTVPVSGVRSICESRSRYARWSFAATKTPGAPSVDSSSNRWRSSPAAQSVTAEIARRAVRYEPAFVYFMDDRSFPEPQAFWVGGSRDSTVVVQPVPARRTLVLTLRNAPVENRVTLESRGWEKVLTMAAGEEQRIEIPVVPGAEAVPLRITASSGFRPSEVDAGSRDERFLGVWVKVEEGLEPHAPPKYRPFIFMSPASVSIW